MKTLILAGGIGKRMQPYSFTIPKPLLPLSDRKPIIAHIYDYLQSLGLKDITISLGYDASLIKAYCQFEQWQVTFIEEKEPLGTAGPIQLLNFNESLLVINGDIVTKCDFKEMLEFHEKENSIITVGVKEVEFSLPFGIVLKDEMGYQIKEKPVYNYIITCGIYIVSPKIKNYIDGKIDFPALINLLTVKKEKVSIYKIKQYWNAIEKPEQLEQEDFKCESIIKNYNLKSVE